MTLATNIKQCHGVTVASDGLAKRISDETGELSYLDTHPKAFIVSERIMLSRTMVYMREERADNINAFLQGYCEGNPMASVEDVARKAARVTKRLVDETKAAGDRQASMQLLIAGVGVDGEVEIYHIDDEANGYKVTLVEGNFCSIGNNKQADDFLDQRIRDVRLTPKSALRIIQRAMKESVTKQRLDGYPQTIGGQIFAWHISKSGITEVPTTELDVIPIQSD